jgi:hypothetical protein
MDHSRIELWAQQINEVADELQNLLTHRQIYRRYGEMVNNAQLSQDGAIFQNWIKTNYVTFVAMSIRRQMGQGKDETSLINLISDIGSSSTDITRKWYRTLYPDRLVFDVDVASNMANQFFDQAAGTGETFDPKIAHDDLEELKRVGNDIRLLANRTVAHNLAKEAPKINFDQADACIDKFRDIASRYLMLLTGSGSSLETVIVDDWQSIFTRPWIQPNKF